MRICATGVRNSCETPENEVRAQTHQLTLASQLNQRDDDEARSFRTSSPTRSGTRFRGTPPMIRPLGGRRPKRDAHTQPARVRVREHFHSRYCDQLDEGRKDLTTGIVRDPYGEELLCSAAERRREQRRLLHDSRERCPSPMRRRRRLRGLAGSTRVSGQERSMRARTVSSPGCRFEEAGNLSSADRHEPLRARRSTIDAPRRQWIAVGDEVIAPMIEVMKTLRTAARFPPQPFHRLQQL